MPELKIKRPNVNKRLVYKCFMLNVRSHRDYVCLEIDNCPSSLDFPSSDEFSIDSSQVVMPVLDKIRFNIKNTNMMVPFWFESKLEVFADGNQIFPRRYCPKCENLLREKAKDLEENVSGLENCNNSVKTNEDDKNLEVACENQNNETNFESAYSFDTPVSLSFENKNYITLDNIDNTEYNCQSEQNINNVSINNILVKELFFKNMFKSKSEILTVNHESGIDEVTSTSLPNILTDKGNNEKSVQTHVSLGNRDFSLGSTETVAIESTLMNKSCDEFSRSNISFSVKPTRIISNDYLNIDKDSNFIRMTTERFKSFDLNEKIRYWSLINSARNMMKINRDVIELNSILKSLAIDNTLQKSNPISSLSPVNLILKLKKLNRSSSMYSFMSEIPDRIDPSTVRKQWYDLKSLDSERGTLGYFYKLNNTFSDNESQAGYSKLKGNQSKSNESLLSMEILISLQKRMLKMMGSFLQRNSTDHKDVTTYDNHGTSATT